MIPRVLVDPAGAERTRFEIVRLLTGVFVSIVIIFVVVLVIRSAASLGDGAVPSDQLVLVSQLPDPLIQLLVVCARAAWVNSRHRAMMIARAATGWFPES